MHRSQPNAREDSCCLMCSQRDFFSHSYMCAPACWRSRWAPPTCEWVALYSATGSTPTARPTLRIPAQLPAPRSHPRRCQKRPPRRCSTSPCLNTKKSFSSSEIPLRKKRKALFTCEVTRAVKQIVSTEPCGARVAKFLNNLKVYLLNPLHVFVPFLLF